MSKSAILPAAEAAAPTPESAPDPVEMGLTELCSTGIACENDADGAAMYWYWAGWLEYVYACWACCGVGGDAAAAAGDAAGDAAAWAER